MHPLFSIGQFTRVLDVHRITSYNNYEKRCRNTYFGNERIVWRLNGISIWIG